MNLLYKITTIQEILMGIILILIFNPISFIFTKDFFIESWIKEMTPESLWYVEDSAIAGFLVAIIIFIFGLSIILSSFRFEFSSMKYIIATFSIVMLITIAIWTIQEVNRPDTLNGWWETTLGYIYAFVLLPFAALYVDSKNMNMHKKFKLKF